MNQTAQHLYDADAALIAASRAMHCSNNSKAAKDRCRRIIKETQSLIIDALFVATHQKPKR